MIGAMNLLEEKLHRMATQVVAEEEEKKEIRKRLWRRIQDESPRSEEHTSELQSH